MQGYEDEDKGKLHKDQDRGLKDFYLGKGESIEMMMSFNDKSNDSMQFHFIHRIQKGMRYC